MGLLNFSPLEKWKTPLLFTCFTGKKISNVQTVPWEKHGWRSLYWRSDNSNSDMLFQSGPAFKHLSIYHFILSMRICMFLILK